MDNTTLLTDDAILADLGERLAVARRSLNLTQANLAKSAGVSKSTVERMEAGHSTQTLSLVRVLRPLGLLRGMESLVPSAQPTPMELLRRRGRVPQRASRRAGPPTEPWTWADES